MALFVEFEKVREDSREVDYAFGMSGVMNRRLTIVKETEQANPTDANRDKSFSAALRKILEGKDRLGHWPNRGAYQA